MKAINLDTYSLSLLTAKEDIFNPRSSTNWALFTYDGATNNLKLSDSGAGGMSELTGKFHVNRSLYGLCQVTMPGSGQRRVVIIAWVGEGVSEKRKEECASHIPAVKTFFKEAHGFISANSPDDVTEEKITAILSKTSTAPERIRRGPRAVGKEETVGTNYVKTNAAMEMHRINRESFWARAEREEEERKEEDRRRAAEDRRRHERERILKERKEAEERDRKMNEKLQMIEEQRRLQAKQEAELRKQEKTRWEQQQREHEEDMRARFRRSESIEKAAEAAALVSQRSMNPREFFRQLSSSSSLSPSSPGSPRTTKPPFRRYQRSLTDTAFIFGKAPDSSSSPRSPMATSPFGRTPTSPFQRSMSPPSPAYSSPTFLPSSPPRRPLVSPPPFSQRSPPNSSLPNLPPSKLPPSPQPNSPPRPPAQPLPRAPTARPIPNPTSSGPHVSLDSSPPQEAPTAPLSDKPAATMLEPNDVYVATRMLSDLEPEADLRVQAVLVDTSIAPVAEEEEEGTLMMKAAEADIPALSSAPLNSQSEPAGADTDPNLPTDGKVAAVLVMATEVTEETDPKQEDSREEMGTLASEPQGSALSVSPTLVEVEEEEETKAVSQPHQQPNRTEKVTAALEAQQLTPQEVAVHPTNGMSPEDDNILLAEQNGTERSCSPSEAKLSPCAPRHEGIGDDIIIKENAENGEETTLDGQLCVRALYDYQAEDESELSLEPGDIISVVETVDKAWWRGCSKDGRQGLFPANYVETI
ncbi:hypothetical protein AGOR_G00049510 [Albula goreensis]|uniref:Drebrin n=1 Tax=Albula goreensis TaxID=1534307 RepID=A0A8T3E1G3_9TELE|nr:hypothetical protein AGOR_G00049510 [Albula goreensis]